MDLRKRGILQQVILAKGNFKTVCLATLAILGMNALPIDWDKWGELALVIISSIDAALLFLYSKTMSIYVMYFCYISYRSLYQVMITIAQ